MPRPLVGLLSAAILCIGCGNATPPPTPQRPVDMAAEHVVGELLADGHPEVRGTVDCALPGDWVVYGWRIGMTDSRAPDGLPDHPPTVRTEVPASGPYTLALPKGPRRFIAAIHQPSGAIAWSDPHARQFPLSVSIEALDLTCIDAPTPAPDGSTVVAQGQIAPMKPPAGPDTNEAPEVDEQHAAPVAASARRTAARSIQNNVSKGTPVVLRAGHRPHAPGKGVGVGSGKGYDSQGGGGLLEVSDAHLIHHSDADRAAIEAIAQTLGRE